MFIRSWGARGSIPVSGQEYVRYGGDTTCLEIRTENDEVIVVDAGSGIRRLGNRLIGERRSRFTLIFTHSHWDHILGFPFFKPIYREETKIDLYGCPFAQGNMQKLLGQAMSPPHFPVPFRVIAAKIDYQGVCSEGLHVDSVSITSIPLSHPNLGMGYKFTENGRSFVFLTDNELSMVHRGGKTFEDYVRFSSGADLLIHDAEYTDKDYEMTRSWGHSTYKDALELALKADVKRFGLFHHNQDRSDDQIDDIVRQCRRIAKSRGAAIDIFGVTQVQEFSL